jgi:hypothetical protein
LIFFSFRNLTISFAASMGMPCWISITRRTAPPAAGSESGTLKFFTATPRRTSRVCTISQSAFIFISSSVVSVSFLSATLRSTSALAPLKS